MWAADFIPFFKDGAFRLFYLLDTTSPKEIGAFSSTKGPLTSTIFGYRSYEGIHLSAKAGSERERAQAAISVISSRTSGGIPRAGSQPIE